jgi:hypothetical protein
MNKFRFGVVAAMAFASATICVAIQRHSHARLSQQNESMSQQSGQLMQMSAENERLSNLISRVKSSQTLSREQLTELLRLRNEVRQLRQSGIVKAQLQETNAQLRAVEAKAEKQLAEAQSAPNYWPKDQLVYAGYSDPESAMKSLLAAMNSGDLTSWRLSCTPEAIAQLENEWQKHGLSEAQQKAEIKAMADMMMSSASGFHILDQKTTSPDETIINLSFDGEGTARKFVLRKVGNEWKFHDLILANQPDPSP